MRLLKIFALLVALSTGAWIIPQEASSQQKSAAIRENGQPGHHLNNGESQIYRVHVQKRNGNAPEAAPVKVMRLNDVRLASERNAGNRRPDLNPATNGSQSQQLESREVNPSNSKGKQKQPQNAAPPDKNRQARLSQPKTNQDENEARITKKKFSTMFTQVILTNYLNKLFNQPKR